MVRRCGEARVLSTNGCPARPLLLAFPVNSLTSHASTSTSTQAFPIPGLLSYGLILSGRSRRAVRALLCSAVPAHLPLHTLADVNTATVRSSARHFSFKTKSVVLQRPRASPRAYHALPGLPISRLMDKIRLTKKS